MEEEIANTIELILSSDDTNLLDFRRKGFQDGHLQNMLQLLKEKSTPESNMYILNLEGNKLSDVAVKSAAIFLQDTTLISELILGFNKRIKNIEPLCKTLESNEYLVVLDLSHIKIGDSGAEAIGDMLAKNKRLKSLKLYRSEIGDDGVEAIASGMTTNSSLQELDLGFNRFGSAGLEALSGSLGNIQSLSLRGCDVRHQDLQFMVFHNIFRCFNNKILYCSLPICPQVQFMLWISGKIKLATWEWSI
eukprot:m.208990 g.208990  ORF g.208990 m.208990 type:complete len:248 (-) comp15810_c0_seq39:2070-2813(-)